MSHTRPNRIAASAMLALLSAGVIAMPAAAQLGGLGGNGRVAPDPLIDERPLGDPPDVSPRTEPRPPTPQHLNRAQAADRARSQHGGRVLSVRWTGDGYRVKLLRHGEVRIVRIADAPAEEEADR